MAPLTIRLLNVPSPLYHIETRPSIDMFDARTFESFETMRQTRLSPVPLVPIFPVCERRASATDDLPDYEAICFDRPPNFDIESGTVPALDNHRTSSLAAAGRWTMFATLMPLLGIISIFLLVRSHFDPLDLLTTIVVVGKQS